MGVALQADDRQEETDVKGLPLQKALGAGQAEEAAVWEE